MSMILDAFVGNFSERLLSFIQEELVMVLGVKEDLKKLQRRMDRIHKVLDDAEKKSLEEDSAIKNWVSELKDTMYEADDILDLCFIEGSLLLDESQQRHSSSSCCHNFPIFSCFLTVSHRHEIGQRISSLNERFDEIYQDRLRFNLDSQEAKTKPFSAVNSHQTSPLVADLDVVGREIEASTRNLVKLMVGRDARKGGIFAITGMGGIGKTTLAQKIYNHQKVQTKFQIKVWLCVSQNYNEIYLLQQVIRGAKATYGEANTKAELVPALRSAVAGKSIFLVLDDVWRADVWVDLLRSPFQSAKIEACILITSRDENVAKQMGSLHIHSVMELPLETGWEMLRKRLVLIGGREEEIQSMREMGIQIVEKCSGLPLAIKAMAGVLAKKEPNPKEWRKVLNSEAWRMSRLPEELRGALYLSYDDLPSPLKQCFLYCSLFPEDWVLFREDLVRLWVAEGFIREEGGALMEETAEEYFHELTRRNLLQMNPLNYEGNSCTMHDLLRALAQFISKDESLSLNSAEKNILPLTKLRKLALTGKGKEAADILDSITEPRGLRTLFIFSSSQALDFNKLVRFLHLRVLDLTGNEIETITSAIGDLVHLRHLDLDRTLINQLPESIGRLSNLQFLSLCGCKSLTFLPQSITQLQNLRRLAVLGTPLSFMPIGMGRLKNLNGLEGFVVGDESLRNHSTLKELSSLSKLSILNIFNLERARPGSLVLKELSQLKKLQLSWNPPDKSIEQEDSAEKGGAEKIFEELVPPQCLEEMYITSYFGYGYPNWLMSQSLESHLPYLTILDLVNNTSCSVLPPLGLLSQLRILFIAGANEVKSIGPEFLGGRGAAAGRPRARTAFPMLQLLTIHRMPNLEKWYFSGENEEDGAEEEEELVLFPRLHELIIIDCPKLSALPTGLRRTALKKLYIAEADSLKQVGNLPSLAESIVLHKNLILEKISNLPSLKCLTVSECCGLKYVDGLNELQQLQLIDEFMVCLPAWLPGLIKERLGRGGGEEVSRDGEDEFQLQLWCNEMVLQRCEKGGEDWGAIDQILQHNVSVKQGEGYLHFVKQASCFI